MKVKNKEEHMNPERAAIWQGHLSAHEARLQNVATDYPCADSALLAKITAGIHEDIRTAKSFFEFHSK